MRYRMPTVLAFVCFAIVGMVAPSAFAADQPGNGAIVMKLKGKDGKSFEIHVPAPNGKPQNVAGLDDLFAVFVSFCLDAFPDDAAVEAKVKSGAHPELDADELNTILHGDPGRGWIVRLNHSAIALTVGQPPAHACGVRATLPTEPDIGLKTATYVGLWGFSQSPPETLLPGKPQSSMAGTVAQTLQSFILVGPDKRPIERIGAYFARELDSAQVQLRLVRMRGNNPH